MGENEGGNVGRRATESHRSSLKSQRSVTVLTCGMYVNAAM